MTDRLAAPCLMCNATGFASNDRGLPTVSDDCPACGGSGERLVVTMTTRKIHRSGCRHVEAPGSAGTPFADVAAIEMLPHCGTCKP